MTAREVILRRVEHVLGHRFKAPELLRQALRHPSAAHEQQLPSYERLEFLGDAALSHAVAELLYAHWPDAAEGELTRARAALVRESALVGVAEKLELAAAIELGSGLRSEEVGPGPLADVLEAVLGALLLDAGWRRFAVVVGRLVGPAVEALDRTALLLEEPKSMLQELAQKQGLPLPVYREVVVRGPEHGRVYVFEVALAGRLLGQGEGRSKRAAQQAAAREALRALGESSARADSTDTG